MTPAYIFVDSPKFKKDVELVKKTLGIVKSAKIFKNLTIIERRENYGLAKNIESGVKNILKKHGKIIVLEDDLIVGNNFLDYMNQGLVFFENEKKIWHISGFGEKVEEQDEFKTYCFRQMNCWGWGTWSDRWKYFKNDPNIFITQFTDEMIKSFNIDGTQDYWDQMIANDKGDIKTWAVFWYATIFLKGGLCINPSFTHVINEGFDGSGVNCSYSNIYDELELNNKGGFSAPKVLREDKKYLKEVKSIYSQRASIEKKGLKYKIYRAMPLSVKKIIKKLVNYQRSI